MSRPKDRIHELRVRPGYRAILVNPKPMSPYRAASFDGASWTVGSEQYGPIPELPMKPAADVSRALTLLEELLWRMRDWAAVYSVRTSGKETKIGVVMVRQPLPASYVPVASPKPELQ